MAAPITLTDAEAAAVLELVRVSADHPDTMAALFPNPLNRNTAYRAVERLELSILGRSVQRIRTR